MFLSRAERLETRVRRAYALKKYPQSVRLLEELLEEVGENPQTLGMLALCCHRANQNERAIAYAERALNVDASLLAALRTMSMALASTGRGEEARVFARRGLDALAREAPEPVLEGWRGWFAGGRGRRPSQEEQDWAGWARKLLGRGAGSEAGEHGPPALR